MLEYHTFAVSLTAAQGKAAHITPSKMLEKLSEEGLEAFESYDRKLYDISCGY